MISLNAHSPIPAHPEAYIPFDIEATSRLLVPLVKQMPRNSAEGLEAFVPQFVIVTLAADNRFHVIDYVAETASMETFLKFLTDSDAKTQKPNNRVEKVKMSSPRFIDPLDVPVNSPTFTSNWALIRPLG